MILKIIAPHVIGAVTHIIKMPFDYHIVNGLFIRLLLIVYASYQDVAFDVKYTDVDYKVFTDAARHVKDGHSPYERHTYRYSPLIAWLMLPNTFIFESFGKILFSLCDIVIAMEIKSYISQQLRDRTNAANIAKYCSLFWLYNPLSIVISTRGNADTISCFTILMSLSYLHSQNIKGISNYIVSGLFLGLSIHLRIYPLIFSLPMYLSLGEYKITRKTSIWRGLLSLVPNRKQIILTFSTVASFVAVTYSMHLLYGRDFIYNTYIYHFFRKDTRHNFSVFFYTSYLSMDEITFNLLKFTARLFLAVILFLLSLTFGCDAQTLPFALFCQSAVLVIYNSVVTSQYFIWYLSLLPLIVHDLKAGIGDALVLIMMWVGSQLSWLFYAYLLEFQNQEVFMTLWVMGLLFFTSNIMVLYQIIKLYTPGYCFGIKNQTM